MILPRRLGVSLLVALLVTTVAAALAAVLPRVPAHASGAPPGPFHVVGNRILTASGAPFAVHGVARPSLEWSCTGQAVDGSPGIPASDFATMAGTWKADTVRLSLNQDFWLSATGAKVAAAESCPSYVSTVRAAVANAEAAGLAVILDLHWSDEGNLSSTDVGQKCMADKDSLRFWKSVAATFAADPSVLFELYNEPHDISWQVWRNGGTVTCTDGVTYTAVGMQQLVNAVRGTGAANVVLAGGLDWAYDLSGVAGAPLSGSNVAYATHPYEFKSGDSPSTWDAKFGNLAAAYPVVATEFGSTASTVTPYDSDVLSYFRSHGIGYTAWAWWAGGPSFPSLISDPAGDCVLGGCDVESDLQAYAAAGPAVPQAAGVQDSFEDGTDGWVADWGSISTAATSSPTFTGGGALAVTVPGGGYPAVATGSGLTGLGGGSTVTYHVYAPAAFTGTAVEPFTQDGSWTVHKGGAATLAAGWNTVTFPVPPQTGMTKLGLQVDNPPAGTLTVDDVAWTAAPAHLTGFEDGSDGWGPNWGTVSTAVTSAPTYSGSGALAVTVSAGGYPAVATRTGLTGLASGTPVTLHVYAPAPITVEPYTQDSAWTVHKSAGVALATGWNTVTFAVPSETGVNALGLQVDAGSWTGQVTLDDVSW